MTSTENLKPLTFDENMRISVGLVKGSFEGLEPLPTKEELIEELKLELIFLEGKEQSDFRKMVKKLSQMTDIEFLNYYEETPCYELVDGVITPV